MSANMRTGGELVVDALVANGVDRVFCVPGESYLAVLDALYDTEIAVTVCRQEGGAAMMAEADGKMTGRPGICMVTRGPGATNAASGVHVARQDSTPMILLVGQIARDQRDREAFQEVDYRQMFGGIAKWVAEIDQAERVPEYMARAFTVAMSGRPGPVVLALPEDMLRELAPGKTVPAACPVEVSPGSSQMEAVAVTLATAERPIVIAGGARWSEEGRAALQRFSERFDLPVACSFRRQHLFDHTHPNYAGDVGLGINPKLAERIKGADVVILIGGRMSETPSQGYTLFDVPMPHQTLIHIHPDAGELGRVYMPAMAINASPDAAAGALDKLVPPAARDIWKAATRAANGDYLEWSVPPEDIPGDVQLGAIVAKLRDELPADTIITNGAGNYATWIHRFWRFRKLGTQLAPTSGSMGYGVPAGVAAKLRWPDRTVIAMAGDGCFQMTGQEFSTAVQYGAALIVVVVDNGIYGTIRMHQERNYPGRVIGTDVGNPDFAALARAHGGHGETATKTEEFFPALDRARQSGKPAILHVRIDPEAITPATTLSAIRAAAKKARGA
ncbi:acetolactate synthase-1/2/3 large subunit [Rhodobium gokarnense]|uniref:Acetolactate synthase-1/2/3 large subunit n=2 Tax=Rhodobium gokarnense TaxID=364296 RepID=A0ABT3HCH0_9HYPH|nr:acetolactate synthase-1/2/3 large subunit [Rhodobium gokarnense]